jgi:CIC family chloride channel protein
LFAIALPSMNISPEAYAVVGMGALLAATTHAPMTAIFLLIEITASYDVILPILLTSIIGTIISQHLSVDSIDTKYFSENKIMIESAKEAALLKFHKVAEIMKAGNFSAPENLTLKNFIDLIENDSPTNFPIVNGKGKIAGVLNLNNLKSFIFREELWQLVLVSDMMLEEFPFVLENEDLYSCLEKFDKYEVDDLPVLDNEKHVVGIIRRSSLMSFLRKQLIAYNHHEAPISEL